MSNIIRIKRSETSGNPSSLANGELAYSGLPDNGSNGGDRLYIGLGTETNGNSANHIVIGGKFFTDRLNQTAGVLTASAAIVVDANKKIDDLFIDNIELNGNTISTTDTNGNLILSPNGTGKVSIAGAYTLPRVDGSNNYVLTTNGAGVVSWSAPSSSSFTINGDTGTTVFSTGGTLTFTGTDPIDTTITSNTVSISVKDATTTVKGAASFNSASFAVTSGDVTIKSAGVSNTQLVNSSLTIGTTSISLGATSTTLAGLTSVTSTTFVGALTGNASTASALATARTINGTSFDGTSNITITAAANTLTGTSLNSTVVTSSLTSVGTIGTGVWQGTVVDVAYGGTGTNTGSITGTGALTFTAGGTNTNINLVPNGTGTVDVGSKRITGVATPSQSTDAANKGYVDNAVQGISWKVAVNLLATSNIALSGTSGTLVIDGHTALSASSNGYRLLLTGQTTDTEKGIYVYNDAGSGYTLTRATDADVYSELIGASVFIEEGTTYGKTGWLQSNHYITSFASQSWVQFTSAGSYEAGNGLTLTGSTFDVVGTTDRITVSADAIDIASTYVGQTSITTLGTITSGTWNATTIATTKGGTGLTSYATGDLLYASASNTLSKLSASTDGKILQLSAGVPVWGDIDGGTY